MESKKSRKDRRYVERDLSWMYFNRRILQEAEKQNVPVLERMSFLGIYSNNLDEFFRVRVASLSRIAESKEKIPKADRVRAKATIKEINRLNAAYNKEFEHTVGVVTDDLAKHGIRLLHETDLNEEQKTYIRRLYLDKLNGSTNPVWLNEIKEIGDTDDDSIYLAVKRSRWQADKKNPTVTHALIKVPDREVGRFVVLPPSDGFANIMYIDDVVRFCLPLIFIGAGKCTYEAYSFKFTKDAEMDIDNDLSYGVVQKVAKGVKSRKRGEPIRVIYDERMPKDLLRKIMSKLNVDQLDTIVSGGRYQNHKDLMGFPDCGKSELRYPSWTPIVKPELETEDCILDTIRGKDRFLHVPYHSFNSFIRLLREAALNPDVREIQATLYRLAKDSKVVNTLICAARNGKKVTVVIELLARFDEESNIKWSKRMQEAGIDAWIRMKINHITDEDVVERLYDAAAAGVKIDIVLRGNCSLMPSNVDNMHVVGIIDRYLEHSRILIFANGGTPRYYMGSADWMPRNLVNRVEVLTPVYDEDLQRDLARTVDYGLRDTTNGRIVDGFGKNEMQQGEPFRSQEHLYVDYLKESQEYNNIRN